MKIQASALNSEQTYKLLSGLIVPRPIAWVGTVDGAGTVNLAPFSCFTFVANRPPMVGINIGRRGTQIKDTLGNIMESREFVINIADESMIDEIHLSAVEYPHTVSEAELLGLDLTFSDYVTPPRLSAVPASMECRLHSIFPFGEEGAQFVVGEVLTFHFRAGLLVDGKVNTTDLRPVCRLGGPHYAGLGQIVTKRAIVQTPAESNS